MNKCLYHHDYFKIRKTNIICIQTILKKALIKFFVYFFLLLKVVEQLSNISKQSFFENNRATSITSGQNKLSR